MDNLIWIEKIHSHLSNGSAGAYSTTQQQLYTGYGILYRECPEKTLRSNFQALDIFGHRSCASMAKFEALGMTSHPALDLQSTLNEGFIPKQGAYCIWAIILSTLPVQGKFMRPQQALMEAMPSRFEGMFLENPLAFAGESCQAMSLFKWTLPHKKLPLRARDTARL